LKPLVVKHNAAPSADDGDIFREAMNQARRATARLAPDGFESGTLKTDGKTYLCWRPIGTAD
jgi:hypothetical protein